ncbi:MAG: hypothetical protein MZU95_07410 [Desulfomicrobium escambiense]|nr:hypothetical protein [Desulfomicrobium escambiense]
MVDYLVDLNVPPEGTSARPRSSRTSRRACRTCSCRLEDSGLPADVSACIVDGMIDEVGETRFDQLVLENNQEEITKLATAQTLKCAAGRRRRPAAPPEDHGQVQHLAGPEPVPVPAQFVGRATGHDVAVVEHHRPVGHLQRHRGVLLHQEHTTARLASDAAHDRQQ